MQSVFTQALLQTSTRVGLQPPPTAVGRLRSVQGTERKAIEQFISARYAEVYGATVSAFMPNLYGLFDHKQEVIAAFGLRCANTETLFLERYLDMPVETVVADHFAEPAARSSVVEIGNLAGSTRGALRRLIPGLTQMLFDQGYRWLAFTGAATLCNAFAKLGLPLERVADASPLRLSAEERRAWGSYYHRAPSVMLGDVRRGLHTLHHLQKIPDALLPVEGVGLP